jgi:hypothetical protein
MKKIEAVIRTLKPENVRFRFKKLRRELFFDGYVQVVRNDQSYKYRGCTQMVYTNQHIGSEYSFPNISLRDKKSC